MVSLLLENTPNIFLTPSSSAELEDVSGHVGVEHLNQSKVHVHSLQTHPDEGGQHEVVKGNSSCDAQAIAVEG